MKKLFTLFIFLCAALSASADELRTVYLKPGSNWAQDNARFALFMYDSNNVNAASWVDFTSISNGLYYAYFNSTKYNKMILCRMNPNISYNNWDDNNRWNQSGDLNAPSVSEPVYTIGESDWGGTVTTSSIESSGCTIHKIYVQDKENTGQTPYFYEYQDNTWYGIDAAWPGTALTTEEVDHQTWYVFKTLKTSVLGRFMQTWNNNSNFAAGGIQFDLSSGDLYYNYYPSVYQSVLASEALTTPAVLHFRSNNGSAELKHYFWNNTGISDEGFTTTSAGDASDWTTITTYKPSLSIQFYTYDNGGDNTDKSDGIDIQNLTGGENYYYFAKLNAHNATGDYQYDGHGIMKMQDNYYLVYSDGWGFNSSEETYSGSGVMQTVGAVRLTPNKDNPFLFEGTLDNTDGKKIYFAIVPASDWSGSNISGWGNLISPAHTAVTDNQYTIDDFAEDECDAMPTTWTRWHNNGVKCKFNIAFNFATMKWTSAPYFERTLPAEAGGFATFSSDKKVAIPAGITAKYPSAVTSAGAITWETFENGIPANQGALLQGEAGKPYKFTPVETPDVVSGDGNITMEPIDADVAKNPLQQTDTNGYTNYILWKSSDVLGFFKVNHAGSYVNAGTAYLKVKLPNEVPSVPSDPSDTGGAPAFFPLTGETTAIDNLTTEPAAKGEEKIYSLDGRRIVGQPTAKGIYIVNGKKLLKK